MKKATSIELFTGAGGLALGLEASRWKHLALVERNRDACETLALNQRCEQPLAKDWRILSDDVRNIRYERITRRRVDMVAGGPPCQPFSLGGKHRAYNDHRDMFSEAVRAVRELRPKCFLFENVKGLLRQSFSTYFNYIVLQLEHPMIARAGNEDWTSHLARLEKQHTSGKDEDLQYRVIWRLLNAADFGVPQHRHRVFIVGFREDLGKEWAFPTPTHSFDRLLWDLWVDGSYWDEHKVAKKFRPQVSPRHRSRVEALRSDFFLQPPPGARYVTVRDALHDLPDPRRRPNKAWNHEFRDGARPYPGHTGSVLDEPSKALKAGDHGVPGGENMMAFGDGSYRYYSIREAARIQTFPDDYRFSGAWSEAMRQLGNAVPVKLANVVGESIRAQMRAR
ncbi:MAG: DNA cytosine methyltransferase [Xanthomonadales bacterium]|nr:DNA cytosine methyltransferase [Xanthomonadales bacterium]